MKEKILYAIWGCLYILCVGLGTVDNAQGIGKVLLMLTAVIFFIPPAIILYDGLREKRRKTLVRVRIISIVSLSLTMVVLIANVMSIAASEAVGNFLHELLILVSAPMICSQYWVLSLFLWACLLMVSLKKFPKK